MVLGPMTTGLDFQKVGIAIHWRRALHYSSIFFSNRMSFFLFPTNTSPLFRWKLKKSNIFLLYDHTDLNETADNIKSLLHRSPAL